MTEIEFDPELISDFIIESRELLDEFAANLIELESNPEDYNTINAIFRAAHTLKGSSAFFNLTHIKNFAHKLENLLDELRNKKRVVSEETIGFLLTGGAMLKEMFGRLSEGEFSTEYTTEEDAFITKLIDYIESASAVEPGLSVQDTLQSIASLTATYKKNPVNPDRIIEQIDQLLTAIEGLSPHPPTDSSQAESKIVGYRYNSIDLSEAVSGVLLCIESAQESGGIAALELEETLGSLKESIETNNLSGLVPIMAELWDDFTAVRDSGIEFDSITINIISEKFWELVGRLEVITQAEPAAPVQAKTGNVIGYRFMGFELPPLLDAARIISAALDTGSFDESAYDRALSQFTELVDGNGLDALKGPLDETWEDFRAIKDSNIGFDSMLLTILKEKLDGVLALVEKVTDEIETVPEKEKKKEPGGPPKEEKRERKTMRIDEDKVDGFMNYVGELIVTSETFNYLQKRIEYEKVDPLTIRAFKNANQAFRELSGELQESLMEIRRVPIKGLLQKVNLMSRELSQQMSKKVKVSLEGQDVQLDKSIAENLEGPLVHIVRNSLDHGLEGPEERIAAEKDEQGLLLVRATADKEFFYLEISDDGRGIDPVKMRQVAVEKGVLTESQAAVMNDKDAVGLIFGAGFSTAKEITDVSGRGVGMDVVRNNIQQLNGAINIDSVIGQGTTITLKIPLSVTLQVIKALLVRVGKEHFIISLEDILETVRPAANELATIEGRGEIINRRGKILPLIRLYQVFDIPPSQSDPVQAILVIVETPRGRYALMVDEVLGQQQVVVKELDAQFKNLSFIAGSATLGDGRLGLVLDANGVVQLAQK